MRIQIDGPLVFEIAQPCLRNSEAIDVRGITHECKPLYSLIHLAILFGMAAVKALFLQIVKFLGTRRIQ